MKLISLRGSALVPTASRAQEFSRATPDFQLGYELTA